MKNILVFVVMGLILSGCNQGSVPAKQHKSVTASTERFKSPAKKRKADSEKEEDKNKNADKEKDGDEEDNNTKRTLFSDSDDDSSDEERRDSGEESGESQREAEQEQSEDEMEQEQPLNEDRMKEDATNNAFTTPKKLKRLRARKPRTPYKNSFISFEPSPENISNFVTSKEKKKFSSLTEQERNISACILAHALSTIDYFNVTKNLCVIRKLVENKSKNINININAAEVIKECASFARGSTPEKTYIATQIAPKVRLSFFLKRSDMPISVINTMWDFAQIEDIVQNNLNDIDKLLKEYGALMKGLQSESSVAMKDVIHFVEKALRAMTYSYRK